MEKDSWTLGPQLLTLRFTFALECCPRYHHHLHAGIILQHISPNVDTRPLPESFMPQLTKLEHTDLV